VPGATRSLVARRDRVRERATAIASRAPGFATAVAAAGRDRRHGGNLLAGALAFRLFGALLPLALLVAVGLGYAATLDRAAPARAGEAVGIGPALLASIAESSKLSAGTRWLVAASALGASLWSAVMAARAIRAAHSVAWTGRVERLEHPVAAGMVLLAAAAALLAVWGVVGRGYADLGAAAILVAAAGGAAFFAIWLGLECLLPRAGAPWRALVPGAAVVAVGLLAIHLGTVMFVAGRIERASETYGAIGVAFTILVWLYVVSRVIVASAMLNAALWGVRPAERDGPAPSRPAASARP